MRNTPLRPRFRSHGRTQLPSRQRDGFVLVLVLGVLVLMLIVILAFFSRAELNRQTSASSAANQQTEVLAGTALQIILGDLLHEIQAGSETDPFPAPAGTDTRKLYSPRTVDTTNSLIGSTIRISSAPSMVSQRVVGSGSTPANLIKQSLSQKAFFTEQAGTVNGVLPPIPARATSANSTNNSFRGGAISASRWRLPGFASTDETIPSPDWICLNREGGTPTNFSRVWTEKRRDNDEYVLGRFAYNLYDVGGLIDINVVGNRINPDINARRGRLHQVSLADAPAPLKAPAFANFVAWRSSGDTNASTDSGALFDPKRNFSTVPADSQAFVTRQDLIRYTARTNSFLPAQALPFLTTFSRDLNAPSHAPDPNRPMLPADPPPAEMNPNLTAVRFSREITLSRGEDKDVTVPAGTAVMARRFPLGKINLLAESNPDAETLEYYFGLEKQSDGSFRYTAASTDYRIKRLSEVETEGREPNFFEVLQAAILTGSLGRDSGNVYTINEPYDANRYYQIMQIGANIIDQWDDDDYPTTVAYPMGLPGEYFSSYGTENLPYFNNMTFVPYRPENDRDRFLLWALFDIWNPHGQANELPAGIDSFRILPRGKATTDLRYSAFQRPSTMGTAAVYTQFLNATSKGNLLQDIGSENSGLNRDRSLVFPNANYSSPTLIGGGKPDEGGADWRTYAGGLLINDYPNIPVAVPEVPPPGDARRPFMNAALEFFGKEKLPPDGNGRWGAKAHNYFRLRSGELENDKMSFDLQYRVGAVGPWITYQRIRGVLPMGGEGGPPYVPGNDFDGLADGSETVTQAHKFASYEDLERATHHATASPIDLTTCFYDWRNATTRPYSVNLSKIDPRTTRFGSNGCSTDPLGTTIRQSTAAYAGSTDNTQFNWRLWFSYFVIGQETSQGVFGDKGFEWNLAPATRQIPPFALIKNVPEGALNNSTNPGRYRDRDGIIRPADGYLGSIPTANPIPPSGVGSADDRPRILNRPFLSVGDMGHAFRDLPWKTLDFSTKNSGDLGLLDAFSVEETAGELPILTGKINLNSAPAPVIATLLVGTAKSEAPSPSTISATEANTLAADIVRARTAAPFRSRGDLVARILTPESSTLSGPLTGTRKGEREAAIRSLSELGQTRTWNFLLDLVVQTGRFMEAGSNANDFLVRSERRYWIHLALDRFTGEVLEEKWERVDE